MTCKICRLSKKFNWRGEKLLHQINHIMRTERKYIKWSKEFWRYEFFGGEPLPSTTTFYRHKVKCLGLEPNFKNPYSWRGSLGLKKKRTLQEWEAVRKHIRHEKLLMNSL